MNNDSADSDASMKLFIVMTRATHALKAHALRQLQASGIGLTDFAVLEVLLNKGSMQMSDITSKVPITAASMTAAIDRLEAKEFVRRKNHECDRRTKIIELTDKGRGMILPIFAEHASVLEKACGGLNYEDKLKLTDLAKKLGTFAAEQLPVTSTFS